MAAAFGNSVFFWGELIDKYKDINANLKTVFTDYAMLKLVLYSPHLFLLFCQSKVGVVKRFSEYDHVFLYKVFNIKSFYRMFFQALVFQ